jgi:hypothetical protein
MRTLADCIEERSRPRGTAGNFLAAAVRQLQRRVDELERQFHDRQTAVSHKENGHGVQK